MYPETVLGHEIRTKLACSLVCTTVTAIAKMLVQLKKTAKCHNSILHEIQ
jgi:hypothetical protein